MNPFNGDNKTKELIKDILVVLLFAFLVTGIPLLGIWLSNLLNFNF